MRSLMGLVVAGGLFFGMTGESKAQFGLSIGNPYYGSGLNIGTPLGYSYGYPNYSSYGLGGPGYSGYNNYYNSGFVAGPGTFAYSSGYRGYAPPVAPLTTYGYGVRPYYGGYGYRGYGYGYRNGFRPFRGGGRVFR